MKKSRYHDRAHSLSDFPCRTVFSPQIKGFEIWQKYQHLFPSKAYAILKIESCFFNNMSAVFFIHKKRLLNILSKHFIDFQEKFPQFESANSLLQSMLADALILRQICNKHDLLLGIILGFGKDNAAIFERRMQIETFLFTPRFHPFDGIETQFFRTGRNCRSLFLLFVWYKMFTYFSRESNGIKLSLVLEFFQP